MNEIFFAIVLAGVSRALILRDKVLGRVRKQKFVSTKRTVVERMKIVSGRNRLDAAFMKPAIVPVEQVILLCHGIGETIEYWLPAQRLLAKHGIATLSFDYSGYGRSTGAITTAQCERDAVAAFRKLQELMPDRPVSILGFSLGSGIATAILARINAHRLILCAAYTSFKEAATTAGIPGFVANLAPRVWDTEAAMPECSVPVLILHGERDPLFPVKMAEELKAACGDNGELIVVPGLTHNQPFYRPHWSYWRLLADWLTPVITESAAPQY
jgi:pimeloyl-ACP methyl ester carboxylesterase